MAEDSLAERADERWSYDEGAYRQLLSCCDRVLAEGAAGHRIDRVAIAWLHVLRGAPYHMAAYRNWFEDAPTPSRSPSFFKSLKWLKPLARTLRPLLTPGPTFAGDRLPPKLDCLLVSHFTHRDQGNSFADPYYGDLQARLAKRQLRCATLLLNHSKLDWPQLRAGWAKCGEPRLLLKREASFADELRFTRRLWRESAALLRESARTDDLALRKTLQYAAAHALEGGSLASLRLGEQIAEAVRQTQPRMLLLTWEGHAWERIALYRARRENPRLTCVGFQHAVLLPRQHALGRPLGGQWDPDCILTAGKTTRDLLARRKAFANQVPLVALGSRLTAPAVTPQPASAAACLVAPEGLLNESNILFDLAVEAARQCADCRFVLRLHPILRNAQSLRKIPALRALPPNASLSQAPMEEDLRRCRWTLYRSSSVAITAGSVGLRPLYHPLHDREVCADPLFELRSWRLVVRDAAAVVDAIAGDRARTADSLEAESAEAVAYCRDYHTPLDETPLLELLDKDASRSRPLPQPLPQEKSEAANRAAGSV